MMLKSHCYINLIIPNIIAIISVNAVITPELYSLIAFCIMPNHVHLLLKPNVAVPKLMQSIKWKSD